MEKPAKVQHRDKSEGLGARGAGTASDRARPSPEWAKGLRQLYDSVIEEQLPGSFDDLLRKLDQTKHD